MTPSNALSVHAAMWDMWIRYRDMMAPTTRAFGKNGREKVVTKAQINNLHTGLCGAIHLAKNCRAFTVSDTLQLLENLHEFRHYALHLAQSRRNGLTANGPVDWAERAAQAVSASLYLIREHIERPTLADVEPNRTSDSDFTFNGIEVGGGN